MRHLKNYKDFNSKRSKTHRKSDLENFQIIFEGLLTTQEIILVESYYGPINENLLGDLFDKTKRGVLKTVSKADEEITKFVKNVGEKAVKLVDFINMIGEQMAGSLGKMIKDWLKKCEDMVRKEMGALNIIVEKIEKTSKKYLRRYVESIGKLIKYVLDGQMVEDIVDKIKKILSKVFSENPNESLYVVDNYEMILEDEGQKETFLQKLRKKIAENPPFSWLPDFDDLIKKSMKFLKDLFNKFLSWLSGQNELFSDFGMGLQFLFGLFESYVLFKIKGTVENFKKAIVGTEGNEEDGDKEKDEDKAVEDSGTNAGTAVRDAIGINLEEVKSKSLEFAYSKIGFDPKIVLNTTLTAVDIATTGGLITAKIKTIKTLIKYLMTAIGIYQIASPQIKRLSV